MHPCHSTGASFDPGLNDRVTGCRNLITRARSRLLGHGLPTDLQGPRPGADAAAGASPLPTSAVRGRGRVLFTMQSRWRSTVADICAHIVPQRAALAEAVQQRLSSAQHDVDEVCFRLRHGVRMQMIENDDEASFKRLLTSSESVRDQKILAIIGGIEKALATLNIPTVTHAHNAALAASNEEVSRRLAMVQGAAVLMPYQREGVRWLAAMWLRGFSPILADEMGLGKTAQSIFTLQLIRQGPRPSHGACSGALPKTAPPKAARGAPLLHGNAAPERGPYLIVAPLSTLPNWASEFEAFAPNSFRVAVLNGSLEERAAVAERAIKGVFDVVIVGFDTFSRKQPSPHIMRLRKVHWGCVIVDEAQRIKNADCALFQTLRGMNIAWRLVLSGTPLQNSMGEMLNLLRFVLPDCFPGQRMLDDLVGQLDGILRGGGATTDVDSHFADEELRHFMCRKMHRLLEPFLLRRERASVLADLLPPKDEHTVLCPLVSGQRAEMRRIEEQRRQGSFSGATVIDQRKVLMHPYLLREYFYVSEAIVSQSGKFVVLDAMMRFLHSTGHKFLVFCSWTKALDIVESMCLLREMPYVRLDGRTAVADRAERVARFNASSCELLPCFLISKLAGGVGLNLQAADTVFLLDTDYNPQRDLQALSRVYRVGQRRHVKVFRLVADDGAEAAIVGAAGAKLAMADTVVHAGHFDLHADGDQRDATVRKLIEAARSERSEAATPLASQEGSDAGPAAVPASPRADVGSQLRVALPRGPAEEQALDAFLQQERKRQRDS